MNQIDVSKENPETTHYELVKFVDNGFEHNNVVFTDFEVRVLDTLVSLIKKRL